MLTGDRRWAPTRKLTVLGKVPKPINLPSQRLENHGLDPNVEIVPKGTFTWGSKPSTAAPNAWGTPSVSSPRADGSAGSPSHRPSSGGSGTRPSTASSDRSHEPVINAWAANSRPSSASGLLASTPISAATTRPRSADTRPGSSQLSRFADNSIDGSAVWGTGGTAERLGATSSKSGGFTLSSGDFPSLGSDKNSDTHSQRGHSSQGRPSSSQGRPQSSQGRPHSSQGHRPALVSETDPKSKSFMEPQLAGNRSKDNSDHETVNTWKVEPPFAGHGEANMANWHRDPQSVQPYANMIMPPPHYDSWQNPPFYTADRPLYRGAASDPYRPTGPPGSYHFDYPHGPTMPISNPQFPRPDAAPGGFYPNNEPYRPYMPPEGYMDPGHPDVSSRSRAFPRPIPYEGFYSPARPNFYSSPDREASVIGVPRPAVHNQYPSEQRNYEPAHFHGRPGRYATLNKEHSKPDETHESQNGPYRVLLKHDGSESCDERGKREHSGPAGSTHLEKGNHPRVSSPAGHLGTEIPTVEKAGSPLVSSQAANGVDVQTTDTICSSGTDSSKAADDSLDRRPEAAKFQNREPQQYTVIKKNATLLEKVEGLNNKARIIDSHNEVGAVSSREKPSFSNDETTTARTTKAYASAANAASNLDMGKATAKGMNTMVDVKNQGTSGDRKLFSVPQSSAGAAENPHHLGQGRGHVASRIRSSRHDIDHGRESSANISIISVKGQALVSDTSEEATKMRELPKLASLKDGSEQISSLDADAEKAQRAKMRELAIQRAKQRQQEEEERTREQKAKALAKLEELNRRTVAGNSGTKSDHTPLEKVDVKGKQESGSAKKTLDDTSDEVSTSSSSHSDTKKQVDDYDSKKAGGSTVMSPDAAKQASDSGTQSSIVPLAQSSSVKQEGDAPTKITVQMTQDTKQKQRLGYRKKHSSLQEGSVDAKQFSSGDTRIPEEFGKITEHASESDTLPKNEEQSAQYRKKNNKSPKKNDNNKVEDQATDFLQSAPCVEGSSEKLHIDSSTTKASTTVAEESASVPSENLSESLRTRDVPVNNSLSDEGRGRGSNQWKSHPQRKNAKNQQQNKTVSRHQVAEMVVWAPVKPPSKSEMPEEANQDTVSELSKPSGKSRSDSHSGLKAKRAEMERYVPKPVAKELSQQANSQLAPSTVSQGALTDMSMKSGSSSHSAASGRVDEPTFEKPAHVVITRNEENSKHSRNGRTNASSWRQRSSVDSPSTESFMVADQSKTGPRASDEHKTSESGYHQKDQAADIDDGWNDAPKIVSPSESVTLSVVGKSYAPGRHRRQSHKVHRGNNYPASDNTNTQQGLSETLHHQSPMLEHDESEGKNITRTRSPNAGVEHARPQWQPKSQTSSQSRQQGNRGSRQRVVSQGTENIPTSQEDINLSSQTTNVPEAGDTRHQEPRRVNKVSDAPAKGQNIAESAPQGSNYPRQQAAPVGTNPPGEHNARFQRGNGPNYRGRAWRQGPEQNFHANGEKRKNSPHMEYQRIGSYDKPGNSFQQKSIPREGVYEESTPAPASKYRERGRPFQRGGGKFYGQSTGYATRVNDSYNSGE